MKVKFKVRLYNILEHSMDICSEKPYPLIEQGGSEPPDMSEHGWHTVSDHEIELEVPDNWKDVK